MDRRTYLISVFDDTLQQIEGSLTLRQALKQSVTAQTMIPETTALSSPEPIYNAPAEVLVTHNRSFEAAAQYAEQKVCVLNFASASNPGGGVTHGSSAQEECLCRCSTLYNCLNTRDMWNRFYTPHRRSGNPLHNDDIIYTPDVQVIKDDDYYLLDVPFSVDVITCAAPNLRERPSNSYNPGEGESVHITPAELQAIHERRARRILSVAAQHGVEVLILGAFGCGAFMNDPMVVAQAYKNVLPDFLHHFRTIEFAIYCRPADDSNYRAFKAAFA
ncbi:MAG: TIGR02452 family protein [Paludibacteraceae bacterium]|nr:TIGR02452 family protein [Paludibacteraceae bacterium]